MTCDVSPLEPGQSSTFDGETLLGMAIVAREYDPETRRSYCTDCRRVCATGQSRCVCGADFGFTPPLVAEDAA